MSEFLSTDPVLMGTSRWFRLLMVLLVPTSLGCALQAAEGAGGDNSAQAVGVHYASHVLGCEAGLLNTDGTCRALGAGDALLVDDPKSAELIALAAATPTQLETYLVDVGGALNSQAQAMGLVFEELRASIAPYVAGQVMEPSDYESRWRPLITRMANKYTALKELDPALAKLSAANLDRPQDQELHAACLRIGGSQSSDQDIPREFTVVPLRGDATAKELHTQVLLEYCGGLIATLASGLTQAFSSLRTFEKRTGHSLQAPDAPWPTSQDLDRVSDVATLWKRVAEVGLHNAALERSSGATSPFELELLKISHSTRMIDGLRTAFALYESITPLLLELQRSDGYLRTPTKVKTLALERPLGEWALRFLEGSNTLPEFFVAFDKVLQGAWAASSELSAETFDVDNGWRLVPVAIALGLDTHPDYAAAHVHFAKAESSRRAYRPFLQVGLAGVCIAGAALLTSPLGAAVAGGMCLTAAGVGLVDLRRQIEMTDNALALQQLDLVQTSSVTAEAWRKRGIGVLSLIDVLASVGDVARVLRAVGVSQQASRVVSLGTRAARGTVAQGFRTLHAHYLQQLARHGGLVQVLPEVLPGGVRPVVVTASGHGMSMPNGLVDNLLLVLRDLNRGQLPGSEYVRYLQEMNTSEPTSSMIVALSESLRGDINTLLRTVEDCVLAGCIKDMTQEELWTFQSAFFSHATDYGPDTLNRVYSHARKLHTLALQVARTLPRADVHTPPHILSRMASDSEELINELYVLRARYAARSATNPYDGLDALLQFLQWNPNRQLRSSYLQRAFDDVLYRLQANTFSDEVLDEFGWPLSEDGITYFVIDITTQLRRPEVHDSGLGSLAALLVRNRVLESAFGTKADSSAVLLVADEIARQLPIEDIDRLILHGAFASVSADDLARVIDGLVRVTDQADNAALSWSRAWNEVAERLRRSADGMSPIP